MGGDGGADGSGDGGDGVGGGGDGTGLDGLSVVWAWDSKRAQPMRKMTTRDGA